MCKDTVNGGYGSCIRQDITENYKCVTENWTNIEYDDRVKNYIPLENGNYMVNTVDHEGVDDNGLSKKINSQPFQFCVYDFVTFKKINERCYFNIRWFQKQ